MSKIFSKIKFIIVLNIFFLSYNGFSQVSIQSTGSMHYPRWCHQSQILPNGKLFAFGGDNCNYLAHVVYKYAEIYNSSTGLWTDAEPMNVARTDFASVVLPDGKVLAIGGYNKDSSILISCETYDFETNTWSFVSPMLAYREDVRAVVLNNGNVLVSDYLGESCEIYNPVLNKWTRTGSFKSLYNLGSLTKLPNGDVAAVGGKTVEVYNHATGTWSVKGSLLENRDGNNAILLNDGRLLLAGSLEFDVDKQSSSEIFSFSSGNSQSSPQMLSNFCQASMIMLDNGNVLVSGLGDFFTPSNTKAIQIFDVQTNTWGSPVVNFIGTQYYGINRLTNGKILISGGSFTTGNGASNGCLLITQTGYYCVTPNLNLPVVVTNSCFGKSANIQIRNTETNVKYQTCILDGTPVSPIIDGGADIDFTVSPDYLVSDTNLFMIKTYKDNCLYNYQNQKIKIILSYAHNQVTPIDSSGYLTFCNGSSVTLNVPVAFDSYLWSNGDTSRQIVVNGVGYYSVVAFDSVGCAYQPSDAVKTSIFPSTVVAGNSETFCNGNSPKMLTGFSPYGGTWSGTGVSSNGMFNSSIAPGSYTLTYTVCNRTAQKSVTVLPQVTVLPFATGFSTPTICDGSTNYLDIMPSYTNTKYTVERNGNVLYTSISGNGATLSLYVPPSDSAFYKIIAVVASPCGNDTLIVYDTLFIGPFVNINNEFISPDTICVQNHMSVSITNSIIGNRYWLKTANSIGNSVIGNGSTITVYHRNSNTEFFELWVQNSSICTKKIFSKQIKYYTMNISFNLDEDYIKGDSIRLINNSNCDIYSWKFDNTSSLISSNQANPPKFCYNSEGTKEVFLYGYSHFGCADSIVKSTNILPGFAPQSNASVCFLDDIKINRSGYSAMHIDKNNNTYTASYIENVYSGSNRSILLSIHKFDRNGNLLWKIVNNANDYSYSTNSYEYAFISDIVTDSLENVYISGAYMSQYIKLGNLKSNTKANKYQSPFIAKIDKNGVPLWIINNDDNLSYEAYKGATCSDIEYVDDNHIYARVMGAGNLLFEDNTTHDCSGLSIVQINSNGKYIRNFKASQGSFSERYSTLGYSTMPYNLYNRDRMQKLSNGNVLINGVVSYNAVFGTNTIQNSYTCGYIAVLDTNLGWKSAFKLFEYKKPNVSNYFTDGSTSIKTAVSADGNFIYVNGYIHHYYYNTFFTYPDGTIDSVLSGGYLAKYSLNGDLIWLNKNIGTTDVELIYSPKTDELIQYGSYTKTVYGESSQNKPIAAVKSQGGASDLFLSGISPEGDVNWIESIGSSGWDRSGPIKTNACGDIVLIGSLEYKGLVLRDTALCNANVDFIGKLSLTSECSDCNSNIHKPLRAYIEFDDSIAKMHYGNYETNNVPLPVKIRFNYPVSGFTQSDILISNGEIDSVNGFGANYTAWVKPRYVNSYYPNISIPDSIATDSLGHKNIGTSVYRMYFDTVPPSVSLYPYHSYTHYHDVSVQIDFNLSESSTRDILPSDFELINCTLISFSLSQETFTVKPINQGLFSITYKGGMIHDWIGNYNRQSSVLNLYFDSISPTLDCYYDSIKCTNGYNQFYTNENSKVIDVIFSEKILKFDSLNLNYMYRYGSFGNDYSEIYNYQIIKTLGNDSVFKIICDFPQEGYYYLDIGGDIDFMDLAYNYVPKKRVYMNYDVTAPMVYSIVASDPSNPTREDSIKVTIRANEWITGLDSNDLIFTNARFVSMKHLADSSKYELIFSPITSGEATVQVKPNSCYDMAGNINNSYSPVFSIICDVLSPVVVLSSTSWGITNRWIPLKIKFSRVMNGFTSADINIVNATLGTLSFSNGEYSVSVSPIVQGDVTISIADSIATDLYGAYNLASDTFKIYYDGIRPTINVFSPDSGFTRKSSFDLFLTKTETLKYYDQFDISVTNGLISNFDNSGDTCTFKVIPTNLGYVYVRIYQGDLLDLAGNQCNADVVEFKYAGNDSIAPQIQINNGVYNSWNNTFCFSVYLSETVSGFSQSCFDVTNASIFSFNSYSSNMYDICIRPFAVGNVTVKCRANCFMDPAFNYNLVSNTAIANYNPSSIEENADLFVEVFPNPVSELVYVKSPIEKIKSVEVKNVLGQTVLEKHNIEDNQIAIDVNMLSAGVYSFEVSSIKNKKVLKVIVQK